MESSFNGKRALVTGAAKGIGREIARELTKCGAEVIAVDLDKAGLESLNEEYPSIKAVVVDLSNWNATKNALKHVTNVDCLVNNVGVGIVEPLTEVTESHIDKSFAVNVKCMINLTQMVTSDLMNRKKPGSVVNISSKASKAGLLYHSVYCATKGAVDAFTRAVALELGPHKIRVNTVNPTVVMTELGRSIWSEPEKAEALLEKIPMQRFCEVQEVANAVVFLLSDKASMITGANLPVDGGYLAA